MVLTECCKYTAWVLILYKQTDMSDCIFCKIINQHNRANIIYENEWVLAFLDANPVNQGHVLVVPKVHVEHLTDLSSELLSQTMATVQKIMSAQMEQPGVDGVNVMQNNYEAAGQTVPHVHFHLIPRKTGDNRVNLKTDIYNENEAYTVGTGIKKSIYKKILVCGGAGFIGSNFIRYRLKHDQDCEIVNFDKLTYAGNLDNLRDIVQNPRYNFVQGDITDLDALNAVIKEQQITHIINFAAETHVDRSIHGGTKDFVLTNSLGVQMILDTVRINNIKKYIQVSTDEVFGALDLDSQDKFTEQTPIMPNMPYAAAKAGGDLMCNAYYVTHKVPVIVTHCSNNYGPYQFPEKVIPSFIFRLSNKEKVPIYGDGKNVRDWIHVDDHASALSLLLDRGEPGQVYNIGSDNERNNLELTRMLLNHFNLGEEMIEFVEDRKGHDRRYAIDSSKIEALGWKPMYPREKFAEGLKQTIEWYLSNPEWVQKLRDRKTEWDEKALRAG